MHSRNTLETLQHSKFILMLFRKPLSTTSVLVESKLNVRLAQASEAAILDLLDQPFNIGSKKAMKKKKKKLFRLSFISVITFNYQYAWVNVLSELCTV